MRFAPHNFHRPLTGNAERQLPVLGSRLSVHGCSWNQSTRGSRQVRIVSAGTMLVLLLSRYRTSRRIRDRLDEIGGDVHRQRILAAALVILGWAALAHGKDMALISNKSNTVPAVTLADLTKVCKGQTSRWPDGKPVSFITRDPSAPEMRLVLDKVYGMSKDEVKAAIASANHGRSDHPAIIVVDSDEAAVKKVESTPGAVGLVDVYSISGGVTVLKVAGKLPLEPGYPLHGN